MPNKTCLILGAAVGYSWPQIAPFVRSLRATGCNAKVVLLTGKIDPDTRQGLVEHSITAMPVHTIVRHLPPELSRKRFNRYWLGWLHRSLPRPFRPTPDVVSMRNALLAATASWFHHPACSRYFSYYRYLRRRVAQFDLVLTTDVRDVIFQADPFVSRWRPDEGVVFLEHDAVHGQSFGNDRWIDMGFGADGLAAVQGKRITCSGLTLAPAPIMLSYLAAMSRELAVRTDRLSGHDGVDQGVHNWLYLTGKLDNFDAWENFSGPVLTMHGMPADTLKSDSQGRILDHTGQVIPVLHQYDRHPGLLDDFLAQFS